MKRIMGMADRAALLSLKTLVVVNLLFLLSFLLVAVLAARTVDAAPRLLPIADIGASSTAVAGDSLRKERFSRTAGFCYPFISPHRGGEGGSMTQALIGDASLRLSVSAAHACDFMRTTQDVKVDGTVVASVSQDKAVPMSVPDTKTVLPQQPAPAQQPAEKTAD